MKYLVAMHDETIWGHQMENVPCTHTCINTYYTLKK
jgi:hypothetical protein